MYICNERNCLNSNLFGLCEQAGHERFNIILQIKIQTHCYSKN